MSLGRAILRIRQRAKMTQKDVSDASGLAVSYISRIENDRVVPSVRTLNRISNGLGIPLHELFAIEEPLDPGDRCPVSLSGRCILDHAHLGRGRKPLPDAELYSPRQLEILRQCNYLLQARDKEILITLEVVLESLVNRHNRGRVPARK